MNLSKIAKDIKDAKENIILLYAFNATGKTRLSIAYKDYAKRIEEDGYGEKKYHHTGVYYNAYSEDLFVWDNNIENEEDVDVRLKILHSNLNIHYTPLTEDAIIAKLKPYNPKYAFRLNPFEVIIDGEVEVKPEQGHGSVTFWRNDDVDKKPIKISRGEERIFIWCFFLALMEVTKWAKEQNEYIFIDDPVSSLDDHNIYITAQILLDLMEQNCDNRKIIVTTHHMGIFHILQTWLKNGENATKFRRKITKREEVTEATEEEPAVVEKTTEYEPKYLIRFLEQVDGMYHLKGDKTGIHLYHLLLLKELDNVVGKNPTKPVLPYHFLYLRQVLECVASFLGTSRWSSVLEKIGIDKDSVGAVTDKINDLSHFRVYGMKTDIVVPDNVEILQNVFTKLTASIQFKL